MNKQCPICKTNLKFNGEKIIELSELGFTLYVDVLNCEKCKNKYTICNNCSGEGEIYLFKKHNKCQKCNGDGVILLDKNHKE